MKLIERCLDYTPKELFGGFVIYELMCAPERTVTADVNGVIIGLKLVCNEVITFNLKFRDGSESNLAIMKPYAKCYFAYDYQMKYDEDMANTILRDLLPL